MSETERERLVEEIAERISWDGGDFTRWAADAVEDHNRWSWRGDGHGPAMRAMYRHQARAAVDILAARLEAVTALADEWEATRFTLPPMYPMTLDEFCAHWFKGPLRAALEGR